MAHRAQRRVSLDGRVDVPVGRVVINLPGTVGTLCLQQRLCETFAQRMVVETQEPEREAPLRLHASIAFGATDPIPVRLLPRDKPCRRSARRSVERIAVIVDACLSACRA